MIRIRRFLIPVGVIVVAIAVAGVLAATRPGVDRLPAQEKAWPVAASTVMHTDAQPTFSVYGEVVAGREVELRALVAGVAIDASPALVEGGIVKKGDLLLTIDTFDFTAALEEKRAQLSEVRAKLAEIEARHRGNQESLSWDRQELELLQRDFDRATTLRARGNASEKFLDNSRMALMNQRRAVVNDETNVATEFARLAQQRAIIKRLEVLVSQAQRDLAETKLTAPFDGFLHSVSAATGKRLSINDRVAALVDADRLDVRVHLSNDQFGRLVAAGERIEGRAIGITWQVGDQRFEYGAEIERLGARIDAASGGVELYARIQSGGIKGRLRPGAFVDVRLPEQRYSGVVPLPETALHGNVVYAIVDHRLQARPVTVVAFDGASVLVRGELSNGEQIVTTRFPEIASGLKVEVR